MSGDLTDPWTIAEPLLRSRSAVLLKSVRRCRRSLKPPERVHRLRVAARRMEAALSAFEPLLPERQYDRTLQRVQRIRRAAGRVRDLDVLILRLNEDSTGKNRKKLIAALQHDRIQRVRGLRKQLPRRKEDRLRRKLKRVIDCRSPRTPAMNLNQWALDRLEPVSGRFVRAGSHVRTTSELHRLRRRAKQLRYSLELFRKLLDDDACSGLLHALQQMQERLGDLNDHASAVVLLTHLIETTDSRKVLDVARRVRKREKRLLKQNRKQFVEWWTGEAADRICQQVQWSLPKAISSSAPA